MSSSDLQQVKKSLLEAGLEIYRTQLTEIQVAERIRLHIMDSGIRVRLSESMAVTFTARSQRSDFPSVEPGQIFEKVRATIGQQALERGYREESTQTIEVKDPMDDARVLDTWHEITYSKPVEGTDSAVDEIRWALGIENRLALVD